MNDLLPGLPSLNGPAVCHIYHIHPAGQPVYFVGYPTCKENVLDLPDHS